MLTLLLLTLAAAQDIGDRTARPADMLGALAPGQEDLAEALAAAAAHPLGSLAHPIRVGGPEGERSYLARLRCADGAAPRIGARTEAGVGGLGSIVHAFALDCRGATPGRVTLVFDQHHEEHREDRAPPGLSLTAG